MNEFERLRELIKDNPGVPVVLKIKGMPEKNFDCRYYITEGFVHGDKLLTEEEMEVELFNGLAQIVMFKRGIAYLHRNQVKLMT